MLAPFVNVVVKYYLIPIYSAWLSLTNFQPVKLQRSFIPELGPDSSAKGTIFTVRTSFSINI